MTFAPTVGFEGIAWDTRLRDAVYVAPQSRARIKFQYEDVSRSFDVRTVEFEFPGVNGGYLQPNGYTARRYPMRCFFTGPVCDLEAAVFEDALIQTGIGRLEHPLYGPINVLPFGEVSRRDDLKTAANQTIIEVVFSTTLGAIYPLAQKTAENEITASIGAFDVAVAQEFERVMNLKGAVNRANAKATFKSFLKGVSSTLSGISKGVASVNRAFRDVQRAVNDGMDVFIGQPLLLARQISDLLKAPARGLRGVGSRLDAYSRLADSIFGSDAGQPGKLLASGTTIALRTDKIANDFHSADLMVMCIVSACITAVVSPPLNEDGEPSGEALFNTKPEALNAAAAVLALYDAAVAWRDAGHEALRQIAGVHGYQVDGAGSYQELQRAVAQVAGFLVDISFTLVPERRIVLDRPRTILDLAAELYGSVDDKLDFLIDTNNLTGEEILELPRGRSILYYSAA